MKPYRLFIQCLLINVVAGLASPPDNIGREYVVMFMENFIYGSDFPLELYITTPTKNNVTVTVTSPKWSKPRINETLTISPGYVQRINISENLRMIGSGLSSKSLLIKADDDIVVYGGNKESYSNDVFVALPKDVLSTDYYAICYSPAYRKTELGVAAVEDGTTLHVTLPGSDPSLNVSYNNVTYHAGDMINVTLNKYDTFQLQSFGDLSGSHIVSNKPVSAYSGNIKTNIGAGKFQDHLVEQLTPVDTWGKKFVTAPIPNRTTGDYFKIIASEDNTVVNINGMPPITISKAGEWANVTLPSDAYKYIQTDKPVMLAQFVLSQQNLSEPADPSMMIIPPYELFGSDYTFLTPEYSHPEYFNYQNEFMIVINETEKDRLLLDDKPMSQINWKRITGTQLVGGYVTIKKGSHNVRHTNPTVIFAGYLYGHAYHESYAFPTGMRLAKINKPCLPSATVNGDGIDNDCDGKIDEEDCTYENHQTDDDKDGKVDEDCAKPKPVNGDWSAWSKWGECSVTCDIGHQERNRSCDNPVPQYNGTDCSGNSTETKKCDTMKNCPLLPNVACNGTKSAILADPVNCAKYIDCSNVSTHLGTPYSKECPYPMLFSDVTKKCEDFTTVTCNRRKEPQEPCEYDQNKCQTNNSGCVPCKQRLPSCVGKSDGKQQYPGKVAYPDYIRCYKNRTMEITKCQTGYFDPRLRKCQSYNPQILNFICQKRPNAKLQHPTECAKYYDCSKTGTVTLTSKEGECKYPDLFSLQTNTCENFTTVNCSHRNEPQAPCQYDETKWPKNDTSKNCTDYHPSCVGLTDGENAVPNYYWTNRHVTCYLNRTMNVSQCALGIWHPVKKICTEDIQPAEVKDFCKVNPHAVTHHPGNCAKYYNCSNKEKIQECLYPDLWSRITRKCENFTGVMCDNRTEPQAPCQYDSTQWPKNITNKNCTDFHASCVGLQDGENAVVNHEWTNWHVTCFKNRTINESHCNKGIWHPIKKFCTEDISPGEVPDFCRGNPHAVIHHPNNCAKYYNCSSTNKTLECHYPDLWSRITRKCENFTSVTCNNRTEPQAPCHYVATQWPTVNKNKNCTDYHPSCVGLPDGENAVHNYEWTNWYVRCFLNRTINESRCSVGVWHPIKNMCTEDIKPAEVPDFCKANPKAVTHHPGNCAKYYNCSSPNKILECHYPDLWSRITSKCENFTSVSCDNRTEPQAPCDYDATQWPTTNKNKNCTDYHPSCIGLPDGENAVHNYEWTNWHVTCFLNRTINESRCPVGVWHPIKNICTEDIKPGEVPDFCKANPNAVTHHPGNCAKYYNCSSPNKILECHYPDLWSRITSKCENFTSVSCDNRTEPQAPCDYDATQWPTTNKNKNCTDYHPSCIGLPDGENAVHNYEWTNWHVTCFLNRTINESRCSVGVWHPIKNICTEDIKPGEVPDFCKANPNAVTHHPGNCAKYYNCSSPNKILECHYPDLWSRITSKCENFTSVSCDNRTEPQAPCHYDATQWPTVNKNKNCTDYHPSCVGLPDGENAVHNYKWTNWHVTCFLNRTINESRCSVGVWHPIKNKCTEDIKPGEVPDFCKANPNAVTHHPGNCAKYYNCSSPNKILECHYPDLWSHITSRCENFMSVSCDNRTEPQAPCQYDATQWPTVNKNKNCTDYHPSCVGLPDGENAVHNYEWTNWHVTCFLNRTINDSRCPVGVWHPIKNKCTEDIKPGEVPDFCKANPNAVTHHPGNCAKYYNCSSPNKILECHYPDLWSRITSKCENFTSVSCDNRTEPQAPCHYDATQWPTVNKNKNCTDYHPSCVGLPDGENAVHNYEWTNWHVTCFLNRTINESRCSVGVWHPIKNICTEDIKPGEVPDFCKANPNTVTHHPGNCAKYYNCSSPNKILECHYPDLWSRITSKCENFTSVSCENRTEPRAPCQYDQNLCLSKNSSCIQCSKRLPSCIGKPDGRNEFPGKLWSCDYISCFLNRMMNITKCSVGKYFNPKLKQCMKHVLKVDVPDFCKSNPGMVIPDDTNCAHYYNCSNLGVSGNSTMECRYPDLFSDIIMQCQTFENVSCHNRTEPQAPCEYKQNVCNKTDQSCIKCPVRLPSCIGQSDGQNPNPNKLWSSDYIMCYKNRTMTFSNCSTGEYFHPRNKTCLDVVDKVDVLDFCKAHPNTTIPDENNCAKFYNCSENVSVTSPKTNECKYPDLFSRKLHKCDKFQSVQCDSRPEPQAPCDYDQNLCNITDPSCEPCPSRLPSCKGLQDGDEPPTGELWTSRYITCLINRTMAVSKCPQGSVFDPNQLHCVSKIPKSDMSNFCRANPNAVVPDSSNCAHYYNCSVKSMFGNHLQECNYPDLFDDTTLTCVNFTTTTCNDTKHEPQAPCEYIQNQCNQSDPNCLPCPKRLPSCIGYQDGYNSYPNRLWKADYIKCYMNRTMDIKNCTRGYFNPRLRICMDNVEAVDVPDYCSANPSDILPDPDNCAHYFNCSDKATTVVTRRSTIKDATHYRKECTYPALFDVNMKQCENFTSVSCDHRPEPQAPCEYQQNHCGITNQTCEACPLRLPSCVGKDDGYNGFPTKLWKSPYIQCYLNRTISINNCTTGQYFNPRLKQCMDHVEPVDVPDYCDSNPSDILPDLDNCAHYFNCSARLSSVVNNTVPIMPGDYRKECFYPDLFDVVQLKCKDFTSVGCNSRTEPQAPCEYQQNLCPAGNTTCEPCRKRLPSCVGNQDGNQPFPTKLWQCDYVTCFKNRTVNVTKCADGEYFNPRTLTCMVKVIPVDVPDYCKVHTDSVIPDPNNCAKFYNCSNQGGKHTECTYPDLYDVKVHACGDFMSIQCGQRMEPQAPCEYDQNICNNTQQKCKPCPERLPSCRGLPDGDQPVTGALWTERYVTCLQNRTMNVSQCHSGWTFDPLQLHCVSKIPQGKIDNFCKANPGAVKIHPTNCAQYYNCSAVSKLGHHLFECTYPDLFDSTILECANFTSVFCDKRYESEAPCEYQQNTCTNTSKACIPCPKRLPSCVGKKDGVSPFPNKLWKPNYIKCFINRTVDVTNCAKGYFNPRTHKCMESVEPVDVPDYCSANPGDILPDPTNCARYFNCSSKGGSSTHVSSSSSAMSLGSYGFECPYPDLFDAHIKQCSNFTSVNCGARIEPQAPCDYNQNLCPTNNMSCKVCPKRLPSCVGKPDGQNVFPGKEWKPDHIVCYKNRTMIVTKCQMGYFHPQKLKCLKSVDPVDVPSYCQANPTDILPDPDNCAHYFNCSGTLSNYSVSSVNIGVYRGECLYPDLFDTNAMICHNFTTVHCQHRVEPQAPCEYHQNLCNKNDTTCEPCPERLPSCKGKMDGKNEFPSRLWKSDYIVCYMNRTLKTTTCAKGKYFNARTLSCMTDVLPVDVPEYCKVHQTDLLPDLDNCARYFNCSDNSGHLTECKYPKLFSVSSRSCTSFLTTRCTTRKEPQAPCEYKQNLCNSSTTSCEPCQKRMPSCIGLPDGSQAVQSALWTRKYVTCLQNRTMAVKECPLSTNFDPTQLICTGNITKGNIDDFCQSNPKSVKADPSNCARYYNCSATTGSHMTNLGHHMMECSYPELFDKKTMKCENFTSVDCEQKHEPQAPCEYLRNLCNNSDPTCVPCDLRMPSCIGLPDGLQPYPNKLWKPDFIRCYKNRTTEISHCQTGYFHPRKLMCVQPVETVDVPEYCTANPSHIVPDVTNCARYVNCSNSPNPVQIHRSLPVSLGQYVMECHYPDLFDVYNKTCQKFESVQCHNLTEPQAPCEYKQNLCKTSDASCSPCPERLPSCVGLPDGNTSFPSKEWKADYITCYKNRTLDINRCIMGYFNPRLKVCMENVDPVDVPGYCKANPSDILPDPDNCAQYFNCSARQIISIHKSNNQSLADNYRKECTYPDLYNSTLGKCTVFTDVKCENRTEPQAPCEYNQNLCNTTSVNCEPCPERLPSCIGKMNGLQSFPNKLWQPDYIHCYLNRTMKVTKCLQGQYFNPRLKRCTSKVEPVDVPDYCKVHTDAMIPDSANCAKFYNCSDPGDHHKECRYPDLYSEVLHRCEKFWSVHCDHRPEPQAPCEYDQNKCRSNDPKCVPCTERKPSCIGLPDGNQPVTGEFWSKRYVSCLKNRTMAVKECQNGSVFDPNKLLCLSTIPKGNIDDYCKANPGSVKPHSANCAQYYNCTAKSVLSKHLMECKYPDLFDAVSLTCKNFTTVNCSSKHEPESPCEYIQNLCNGSDRNCIPCPVRLPSCIGFPDGKNPHPTKLWKSDYIQCNKNRTINMGLCLVGYFHPREQKCKDHVEPVDIPDYCAANPLDILPDPDNCAQYFNCSSSAIRHKRNMSPRSIGRYQMECTYPDLFDSVKMECSNFSSVQCKNRREPMAPCDYDQNICDTRNTSCIPCQQRLPSCVGQKDGHRPFPGRLWHDDFVNCYKNRTMSVSKCHNDEYFNPRLMICTETVQPVDSKDFCKAHPTVEKLDPANCAKYLKCDVTGGRYDECTYPDLFSTVTNTCLVFTNVTCQNRTEPQAPCDYDQNKCQKNVGNCELCSKRLPSCIGLVDGLHVFPNREWKPDYIKCYKNRTTLIEKCKTGYFHPVNQTCSDAVNKVDIKPYCSANPNEMLPDADNCARYYNCSAIVNNSKPETTECTYPDLYSIITQRCEEFTSVSCHNRKEPQAPCEYEQNLCNMTTPHCDPCPQRLPSCIGQNNGLQAFGGHEWSHDYITCYQNRTIHIDKCRNGFFNPKTMNCENHVDKVDVTSFCRANPTAVIQNPNNCAQYYNCSTKDTKYGGYLDECKYPDLFSMATNTCQRFQFVNCRSRQEPQAPCEYRQNFCNRNDPNCPPCPSRLPSCVGQQDGSRPFPNHYWTSLYVTCVQNRTLSINHCPGKSVFNPNRLQCENKIEKKNIEEFCKSNPNAVKEHPMDCGKYVDCSADNSSYGRYIMECPYPDLFSVVSLRCERFISVACGTRKEPQEPCEYDQNICKTMDRHCIPCPSRLPSCEGLPDGKNAFPSKTWKSDYIVCYRNRTVAMSNCTTGYFHPIDKHCKNIVDQVDIPEYCSAHRNAVLPNPDNCAEYYECDKVVKSGLYKPSECRYPDLFSVMSSRCEQFTTVQCQQRKEPQAPCEYEANLCISSNQGCTPCPKRLPSCVGKPDGNYEFAGRVWLSDYIVCYKNRTTEIKRCPTGYFHPIKKICQSKISHDIAPDYCAVHPMAIVPKEDSCNQYYNCSAKGGNFGKHIVECPYPELFSRSTLTCQTFLQVSCDSRPEPMSPCQYKQNLCSYQNIMNCKPCPERLPSCVGLEDGNQPVPTHLWQSMYVNCLHNRTINVRHCPMGAVFDPNMKICVNHVTNKNIGNYCTANPKMVIENPANCGQYFNCSATTTPYGRYLQECEYPELFSTTTQSCRPFTDVKCNSRPEPEAPCEYIQNLCDANDKSCVKCPERLPSCIGLSNGQNPFPGKLWTPNYIDCYKNRTVNHGSCTHGYFNPRLGKCTDNVEKVDVPGYCSLHKTELIPDGDNCGQYFNCSDPSSGYLNECTYPDLFSTSNNRCERFTSVFCQSRPEPQAPCEYMQNLCLSGDPLCQPCLERLPSCIGLPDGNHVFPGRQWSHDYITCFRDRTIDVSQCPAGEIFHLKQKRCQIYVPNGDIQNYCKVHAQAVIPHPSNCAQYYDCSQPQSHYASGPYLQECSYPDLYSIVTKKCEKFTAVKCGLRHEPKAPCEYVQNLCQSHDQSCVSCPLRLPSCLGLQDGNHYFTGRLWKQDYITCYKNRTINMTKCHNGFFHPVKQLCIQKLEITDIPSYCSVYPRAIIPHPTNCAMYINCSSVNTIYGNYIEECQYPMLFSAPLLTCVNFTKVDCKDKTEPQAPCEYEQNLCVPNDKACKPCSQRMYSCRGLPNGANPVPGHRWENIYLLCLWNRTLSVNRCKHGNFDPIRKLCDSKIKQSNIDEYCRANPSEVIEHPTNCGQYINCSNKNSRYGHYIEECPYPQLFSKITLSCQNFTTVSCGDKFIPQAPCEYLKNIHQQKFIPSLTCPERLPSCIGQHDGQNVFPGKLWTEEYIVCYRNRTVHIKGCQEGWFNPYKGVCTKYIDQVHIPEFCRSHPKQIIPNKDNCAQFYKCSNINTGTLIQECNYPDLFSDRTLSCQPFTSVHCGQKYEPQLPCQYEQNQCKSNMPYCQPCEQRIPSCQGLKDGKNPISRSAWSRAYLICQKNRTISIEECDNGLFDPLQKKCKVQTTNTTELQAVCRANPQLIFQDDQNCARYYNCSHRSTNFMMECSYPDLFSTRYLSCREFQEVKCNNRTEPQAPCDYNQNKCRKGARCIPCEQRLPSCVGLPEGQNTYPGKPWTTYYIICHKNRTINRNACHQGIFHPVLRKCVTLLHPKNSPMFCRNNPAGVIANKLNAAQYFDCSNKNSRIGQYISECPYPQLFSAEQRTCLDFRMIQTDIRPVPQAPCQYIQNLCDVSDQNCAPCEERHHSCVGLPDGNNAISSMTWTPYYVTCLLNRTLDERKCSDGVFDPVRKMCVKIGNKDQIDAYCKNYPEGIVKHPDNCALYYNCSDISSVYGKYINECPYPQMYSTLTHRCEDFTDVECKSRNEPQSPCEYLRNLCNNKQDGCIACPLRFPSCIGLPDGDNGIVGRYWSNVYVKCYRNRTMATTECRFGQFDPRKRTCINSLSPEDSVEFCKSNPGTIIRSSVNCAQYIDCSTPAPHIAECRYPGLFSFATLTCRDFNLVECGHIYEPQSPCEYNHTQCQPGNSTCLPCQQRFPSCIGLHDGRNLFPKRNWTEYYIICNQNRTIDIQTCAQGIFNPIERRCTTSLGNSGIRDFCVAHPGVRLQNTENCAQYYDCSNMNSVYKPYLHECKYPQLYSVANHVCEDFDKVTCGSRPEPMAPCQYLANACPSNSTRCTPCLARLPSCVNLPDGNHPFTEGKISPKYIRCFKNRTLAIDECPSGKFDSLTGRCSIQIKPVFSVCDGSRNGVNVDPNSCARYYNCTDVSIPILEECEYPLLFSTVRHSCQQFEFVNCGKRYEPKAPCEYTKNQCRPDEELCSPCPERLPSCVGLSDGNHAYPGLKWSSKYIYCERNRTIRIGMCADGIYHYKLGDCVGDIDQDDIPEFCRSNPGAIVPYSRNCAKYFNCSRILSNDNTLQECPYPQLFHRQRLICDDFWDVDCDIRYEPMSPCDYTINTCTDNSCRACEDRYVSCVGKPDGSSAIPGTGISAEFVICEGNRTMARDKCSGNRVFSPDKRRCVAEYADVIEDLCRDDPNSVQPHPYSCAQFIDCSRSRPGIEVSTYTKECRYPLLFSSETLECRSYNVVHCDKRHEPIAPCDYLQYRCAPNDNTCLPCTRRHPSCKGLPNGKNKYPDTTHIAEYIVCFNNRTVQTGNCPVGEYFEQMIRRCISLSYYGKIKT